MKYLTIFLVTYYDFIIIMSFIFTLRTLIDLFNFKQKHIIQTCRNIITESVYQMIICIKTNNRPWSA